MTKSPKYNRNLHDYEENRLRDLCDLYQQAYGIRYDFVKIVGNQGNETLQDIACSEGRYNQFIEYYVNQKRLRAQKEDPSDDMEKALRQLNNCFDLMKERNKKYGASWKVLSITSLAALIEMKMNRVTQLGEVDAKTFDEFSDCLNYACFALMKLEK